MVYAFSVFLLIFLFIYLLYFLREDFAVWPKLVSHPWSTCLSFQSAGIAANTNHTWQVFLFLNPVWFAWVWVIGLCHFL